MLSAFINDFAEKIKFHYLAFARHAGRRADFAARIAGIGQFHIYLIGETWVSIHIK
jgi:hypothetical protein